MPNVGYTREEYRDLKPRWDLIRDCLAGETQIKDRGTTYLPKPNPEDTSAENTTRYNAYKARAVFYGVGSRTVDGLVGQVSHRDPVIELPNELEPLLENVDGSGVSLPQQANQVLRDVLSFSRGGLLVDYPKVESESGTTVEQLKAGDIRPTITYWQPWDIINWRTKQVGGVFRLSLIVLTENYVTDDDGFEEEKDDQWRVLRLDENNNYVVEEWIRWNKVLDGRDVVDYELKATWMPKDHLGNPFDHIPFVFVGSQNNSEHPDLPLLYDLCSLNIAHYRNSADYEDSCYLTGQPTPVFSGLTEQWVNDVLKGRVMLGSRASVSLPEGGGAELLQASPNSMPFEAMQHKEKLMVALGAKLVEQQQVQRTATEATNDKIGEDSVLTTVAKNVSAAYRSALGFALQFVSGNETEIVFELNTDFEVHKLTPEEQNALVTLWQSRAIVTEEMRDRLRKGGVAYLEDEEYKSIKETEEPALDLGASEEGFEE